MLTDPSSAESFLTHGLQLRREGRQLEAQQSFEQAIALARREASSDVLARALTGLAQIKRDLNDRIAALAAYAEAIELFRRINDRLHLAHALRHTADILSEAGDFTTSRSHHLEAIALYRELSACPLDLANALRVFALNDERQARQAWTEAATLYEQAGVQKGVDNCNNHKAALTELAHG